LVQFSVVSGEYGTCCGVATIGERFSVIPNNGANRTYYFASGGLNIAGDVLAGNMCIAGSTKYYNGSYDGVSFGSFTCSNECRLVTAYGGGTFYGNVHAVAFYNTTLTAGQVAAVAAAMAAL